MEQLVKEKAQQIFERIIDNELWVKIKTYYESGTQSNEEIIEMFQA
jgi:hypothetical protein